MRVTDVEQFSNTVHVETVVLLSHKKPDGHINVKVEFDAPNAVEELKQPRKHPTAEKVEAIKDALKYYKMI